MIPLSATRESETTQVGGRDKATLRRGVVSQVVRVSRGLNETLHEFANLLSNALHGAGAGSGRGGVLRVSRGVRCNGSLTGSRVLAEGVHGLSNLSVVRRHFCSQLSY